MEVLEEAQFYKLRISLPVGAQPGYGWSSHKEIKLEGITRKIAGC